MRTAPPLSALPESLVYNRKRAAARSYNICRSRDIVSLGASRLKWMATRAIRLIACYFELPWRLRTRSPVSLSLLSFSFPPFAILSCPPPIEEQQPPLPRSIFPRVVPVLCVSEAEETRRADPRSGVVKIRRAATPDTAGNVLARQRESERERGATRSWTQKSLRLSSDNVIHDSIHDSIHSQYTQHLLFLPSPI